MDRARRTAAQWAEICEAFEASGRTVTSFCAERGMSTSYFYKRHKRWRHSQASAFVPVQLSVSNPVTDWTPISIEVDELTIRCSTATPPSWVADLVRTLRS